MQYSSCYFMLYGRDVIISVVFGYVRFQEGNFEIMPGHKINYIGTYVYYPDFNFYFRVLTKTASK